LKINKKYFKINKKIIFFKCKEKQAINLSPLTFAFQKKKLLVRTFTVVSRLGSYIFPKKLPKTWFAN